MEQISKNEMVESARRLGSKCEKCQEIKNRIAILEKEAVNAAKTGRFIDVYILMLSAAKLDLDQHKKEEMSA